MKPPRNRPSPALGALLFGLAACDDPQPVVMDSARFDARDSVVDPRRDVAPTEVYADADVITDAQPFDAIADRAVPDARPTDATARCAQIADDYGAAVVAAQSCLVGAGCRELVCETLCCACRVFVNPASEGFARIAALAGTWRSERCEGALECPRIPCEAASAAACSAEGRCVTLRGVVRDAGAPDGGDGALP